MKRFHLSWLALALAVCVSPASASESVKASLAEGRRSLDAGQHVRAVTVLESCILRAEGCPTYLNTLRRAYRAAIDANALDRADYERRLRILGETRQPSRPDCPT